MRTIIKLLIGILILILLLYLGIVFYLVYVNQENISLKCNFTDCNFLRYNFTNAVNNLDNQYNISINRIREAIYNGTSR